MFKNEMVRILTSPLTVTKIEHDMNNCAVIDYIYNGEEFQSFWSEKTGFSMPRIFPDERVHMDIKRKLSGQTIVTDNKLVLI